MSLVKLLKPTVSNSKTGSKRDWIANYRLRRFNSSTLFLPTIEAPVDNAVGHSLRQRHSRQCAHECSVIFALLGFCVSVIVKGVAYDNSRWANYDQVDVFNNKEQFPVMSSLIGNIVFNFFLIHFLVYFAN